MIAEQLFPSMTGMEFLYRTCAARVHLEVLEAEGLASRGSDDGRDFYYAFDKGAL